MFWIFRRRFDFYHMLAEQAKKSRDTLQALVAFMDNPSEEAAGKVEFTEREADKKRTDLIKALNSSFVTPIDREDLYEFSRALDDMADYARSTVEEMKLFGVVPNPRLREMAVAMENGSRLLLEAVCLLPQASVKNGAISEFLIKVKKLENFIERIYRQALRELFDTTEVIDILKTREIYRHLSNAADRMDQAANILGDILMKSA
ncbi:MAG: DUF47 family protein [Elusimicrobia bacterium]|nr:DUF47 family protein [Elusimicrobiota bacterium]